MSLLDNIPEDAEPLVITLDFSQYEDGAKYSSLFRTNFERFKEGLGLEDGDYATYVGTQLLERLKTIMEEDARELQRTEILAMIDAASGLGLADLELTKK